MMFPILLRESKHKEPLMRWLNERQVETRDLMPLINQPIYRWIDMDLYPVSKHLIESGFYLGCHEHLSPDGDDIQYALDCFETFFRKEKFK